MCVFKQRVWWLSISCVGRYLVLQIWSVVSQCFMPVLERRLRLCDGGVGMRTQHYLQGIVTHPLWVFFMKVIVVIGWMMDVPCNCVIGRTCYCYWGFSKDVHASCACDINLLFCIHTCVNVHNIEHDEPNLSYIRFCWSEWQVGRIKSDGYFIVRQNGHRTLVSGESFTFITPRARYMDWIAYLDRCRWIVVAQQASDREVQYDCVVIYGCVQWMWSSSCFD